MAESPVDWTVDKLLSFIQSLSTKAAVEKARLQQNRAHYMQIVKHTSEIADPERRTAVRNSLTAWIHRQVDAENAFNDGAAKFASAKAALKQFLTSISITPPSYLDGLGVVPLVPVAIVAVALVAAAALVAIALKNSTQAKGLSDIEDVIGLAKAGKISAGDASKMIDQIRKTADTTQGQGDPFGVSNMLKNAVPVALLVLAILVLPKIVPSRRAA